ncbi:MAG: hypothetical protein SGILL_002587, partial [Bacillariaceae sp.]
GMKREEWDMIHKVEFNSGEEDADWHTMDRAGYWDKILHWKNLYITNQNNARNLALDWYISEDKQQRSNQKQRQGIVTPSMVDYILPWDGNCFLTQAAHDTLQEDLMRWNSNSVDDDTATNKSSNNSTRIRTNVATTPIKYFFTRMDRLKQDNKVLLDPNYKPLLKEEPQVIMHRTAVGPFDPWLRYGQKNKVAMLIRLRIPGSWDKFHNGDPPPAFDDWQGPTRGAGWVSRLFSGSAQMEEANKSQMRGKARSDGMMTLVQHVDLQVAQELHGWNESTWMYFDRNALTQHATAWRKWQGANASITSGATSPNDVYMVRLVQNLLEHANASLTAGPWSVMEKEPCGCGPSGDCHRYYNVKGKSRDPNATLPAECASNKLRYDRDRLDAFQYNTTVLALAYTVTGDRKYAERAATNLVTWFVDPSIRMSPDQLNIVWSGKSKDTHNSKLGTIDFKDLYFFLDAVRMIEESGALSLQNQKSIKDWFTEYLGWLTVRTDESFRRKGQMAFFEPNHHGLYYDLQHVAVASFTGNLSLALQIFQEIPSRLLTQVHNNGKLMMEVGGSKCEHLQAFTLQGWASLARMAKRVGFDYWKRFPSRKDKKATDSDTALCRAAEYTIPLLQNRERCTDDKKNDPSVSRWFPLYLEAQRHCPNLAVTNGKYFWPDWFPKLTPTDEPLQVTNPYRMKPLHSQTTGIPPFWNLGWGKNDFDPVDSNKVVPAIASPLSEPLTSPTIERNLTAIPGYYKKYLNGTDSPPKVYLYDVLPAYQKCLNENDGALERYKNAYKHGGEVWFLEQVASSPWRTHDKDVADLFVIPLLPGFVMYQKVCEEEAIATLQWIKKQRREQHSTLRNHVLLTTHYVAEEPTVTAWCPECIHLHQENTIDAPDRHGFDILTVSVPMMSQLYRVVKDSPHQSTALSPAITEELRNQDTDEFLKTRPRAFYFAGQADNRKAYKGRKQVQRVWEELNLKHKREDANDDFTFIITKENPKYTSANNTAVVKRDYNFTHDVSTTRFGYQGRGDNPTSSRIYEWIDVGAIPVVVIDDAWLPGRHIAWKDFTISIRENLSDEQVSKEFERIAYELPIDEIDSKRQILRENAPAILWAAQDSVVAEVMLVDAWEALQEKRRLHGVWEDPTTATLVETS